MKLVATIGTTGTFPRFSELIAAVVAARPELELVFQAGRGPLPELAGVVDFLPHEELLSHMRSADLVVCHGGLGSVRDGLRHCGNVAVVPRRWGKGEGVIDEHQLDLARALEARSLVRVVSSAEEILAKLVQGRRENAAPSLALPLAVVDALRGLFRRGSPGG